MVGPTKKIVFEGAGLGDIKRDAQLAAKEIEKLQRLIKDAGKVGGRAGAGALNIFAQQEISIREKTSRLADYRRQYALATDDDSRARLGGLIERSQMGVQAVGARAQTVAGQMGFGQNRPGIMRRVGGGLMRGASGGAGLGAMKAAGPLVGGAMLAGAGLAFLAKKAKEASDAFAAHQDKLLDFTRSISTDMRYMFATRVIGGQMRDMGFGQAETLGMGQQLVGAAGLRGGEKFQKGNLLRDIMGAGRLARVFGMSGQGGAGLVGQARAAGIGGDDMGGFLGAVGQRGRQGAPAIRGRVDTFLRTTLEYLSSISTTLEKGERRGAVDVFSQILTGLSARGPQFGGETGRRLIQSVDEVMKSGSGIIGGMFARSIVRNVAGGEGGSQFKALIELEKGLMAGGGKIFQDMVKSMADTPKGVENLAVLLSKEANKPVLEMKNMIEAVKKLDLTGAEGLAKFKKEVTGVGLGTEGDQLRSARAKMADAMIKFGESVPIFRRASIMMGNVAGILLKEERQAFIKTQTGAFGGLSPSALQKVTQAVEKSKFSRSSLIRADMDSKGQPIFTQMMSNIFKKVSAENLKTNTGKINLAFSEHQRKLLARFAGDVTTFEVGRGTAPMNDLLDMITKLLTQFTQLEITLVDEAGKPIGRGEVKSKQVIK